MTIPKDQYHRFPTVNYCESEEDYAEYTDINDDEEVIVGRISVSPHISLAK